MKLYRVSSRGCRLSAYVVTDSFDGAKKRFEDWAREWNGIKCEAVNIEIIGEEEAAASTLHSPLFRDIGH